jgi:phosphodiesterase/alkaline phosphatase D-like protein
MAEPPRLPAERLWYDFTAADFRFFMVDTRTEREARTAANVAQAQIMGPEQLQALKDWMDDNHKNRKGMPMFIASPASFLPRHRKAVHKPGGAGALRSDGWDGYPASFHAIVAHIAGKGIRNVVFLSGDEHISFATTAIIRARGAEVARIHSIHSSGLYAPFAFANATRDSLGQDECFDCGPYELELRTDFAPPGDGFTLLRVSGEDAAWQVEYLFDRERPPGEPEAWTTLPR